jgi:hypothetical protein
VAVGLTLTQRRELSLYTKGTIQGKIHTNANLNMYEGLISLWLYKETNKLPV